jgi:hypothetical protein
MNNPGDKRVFKLELRNSNEIMTSKNVGALRATRLSFSHSLIRKMTEESWKIHRFKFELDSDGRGEVIYKVHVKQYEFYLFILSDNIPGSEKEDRVIADRWDAVVALCQGPVTESKLQQLRSELPKQKNGRLDPDVLVLTRGNRSSRFFDYVVASLAEGKQPDIDVLSKGGYILRTTAFYGNGKPGTTLFEAMDVDHPLSRPYYAQMLTALLFREYITDLADHLAQCQSSEAVRMNPKIKRYLGIGNSTGLGIAMLVYNHPKLIHTWVYARELALAYARAATPTQKSLETINLLNLLERSIEYFRNYPICDNEIFTSSKVITKDLKQLYQYVCEFSEEGTIDGVKHSNTWNALYLKACFLDVESKEVLISLLIEIYPSEVDWLNETLRVPETFDIIPEMGLSNLRELLHSNYAWVFNINLESDQSRYFFWYYSQENGEPRVGVRGEDLGEELQLPYNLVEVIQQLDQDLITFKQGNCVAEFLFYNPQYRWIIERVQSLQGFDYGEIHESLIDKNFIPVYLMRLQLAVFGMDRFDPESNKWVRVTLFQGAPIAEDINNGYKPDWLFPIKPKLDVIE